MELTPHQEAVADHAARELGPITGMIDLAPPRPESLPLKLLHIPATEHKPFQLLLTAGMSRDAMAIPEDAGEEGELPPERIELLLGLPPDWPVEGASGDHLWPLRLLARLARLPSEAEAWLMEGHTIPNGDPPHPYAPSTELCCALVAPPLVVPPESRAIALPGGAHAHLLGIVPLFEREVEAKLKEGVDALFERLDAHGINEVFFPGRRSVAGDLLDLLDGKR